MKATTFENSQGTTLQAGNQWLIFYYFLRAAVSFTWVGAALTIGVASPGIAAVLLIIYPAWDAVANFLDGYRNGGVSRNPSQAVNVILSLVTTIAIAVALANSLNAMLAVFGGWALASGLLQLLTALRRWKVYGAQWVMILSGAQSALAGAFFIKQATSTTLHGIVDVVPYVAFGAFYFLVSAIWLAVTATRRRKA